MWLELGRRITMAMLIVAVAIGFAVPAPHAQLHYGQVVVSAAMGTDTSSTCAHDGCGFNQHAGMQGTCFASCAGVTVLPAMVGIFHFTGGHDLLAPALDSAMADRAIPPDPYPPKRYELI